MKLEVGMYVRYEYEKNVYIGKIKFISEVMCGLDETLQINIDSCIEEILKRDIVKASHNIIDLIEVGDYVNGHKVLEIYKDRIKFGEDGLVLARRSNYDNYYLYLEDINSIVTKEQFESMKYSLEG